MSYKVFVISESGKPLMPTKRFGRVRGLLDSGKAKVVSRKPFVIRLLYETPEYTQPLTLGIDTGSAHIGVGVVGKNGEPVFSAVLGTRTRDVTKKMKERSEHRRKRRRHRRERRKRRAMRNGTFFKEKSFRISALRKEEKSRESGTGKKSVRYEILVGTCSPGLIRFHNRKRPEGWLTPTANHLLLTHIGFVRKIGRMLPLTDAAVEYAAFDIHKILNPGIRGTEYQNGRMKDAANIRQYVLCRDGHTCQLCGRKTGEMQTHHIRWLSEDGKDVPENMITLCPGCHEMVHKCPKTDAKVRKKFGGIGKNILVHTSLLNSVMPAFCEYLAETFGNVTKTYGYETKEKRRKYGLPKNHATDAYLIALGDRCFRYDYGRHDLAPFVYKQYRRHNRQIVQAEYERTYKVGRKTVAKNRRKKTGQKEKSLADLTGISHNELTAVPGRKRIRSRTGKPFGVGDVVKYGGRTEVVRARSGGNVIFEGGDRKQISSLRCRLVKRNQGIVCL